MNAEEARAITEAALKSPADVSAAVQGLDIAIAASA